MKTEFYMHPEKGICLLISDFASNELNHMGLSNMTNTIIRNPNAIAIEIRNDNKIPAIKELRVQTGWSLKEAKEYLDKYMPQPRLFDPQNAAERFLSDHTLSDFLDAKDMQI